MLMNLERVPNADEDLIRGPSPKLTSLVKHDRFTLENGQDPMVTSLLAREMIGAGLIPSRSQSGFAKNLLQACSKDGIVLAWRSPPTR